MCIYFIDLMLPAGIPKMGQRITATSSSVSLDIVHIANIYSPYLNYFRARSFIIYDANVRPNIILIVLTVARFVLDSYSILDLIAQVH